MAPVRLATERPGVWLTEPRETVSLVALQEETFPRSPEPLRRMSFRCTLQTGGSRPWHLMALPGALRVHTSHNPPVLAHHVNSHRQSQAQRILWLWKTTCGHRGDKQLKTQLDILLCSPGLLSWLARFLSQGTFSTGWKNDLVAVTPRIDLGCSVGQSLFMLGWEKLTSELFLEACRYRNKEKASVLKPKFKTFKIKP